MWAEVIDSKSGKYDSSTVSFGVNIKSNLSGQMKKIKTLFYSNSGQQGKSNEGQ